MQRSVMMAEYRELKLAKQNKHSLCFFKNMVGVVVLPVFCIHVSFVMQEELTNFNVAKVRSSLQRKLIS
jgi:hypothetical protein